MKKFFVKLDKNFMNFILLFIIMLIEVLVLRKYNMSFFDMCISSICIGIYLGICDSITASFKEE